MNTPLPERVNSSPPSRGGSRRDRVHEQHRLVTGIERVREVESALLHPALEVGGADPVGRA